MKSLTSQMGNLLRTAVESTGGKEGTTEHVLVRLGIPVDSPRALEVMQASIDIARMRRAMR